MNSIFANLFPGGFAGALLVVAVAVAVFLLSLGLAFIYMRSTDAARRRVGEIGNAPAETQSLSAMLAGWAGPFAKYIMPSDDRERSAMEKRMVYAGYRSANALPAFYAIKTILAISLPLIVFALAPLFPKLTNQQILFACILAAFLGLVAPNYVLGKMVDARQKSLRNGFPDALDLLVVCVESGLGLAAALQRVSDEIGVSHPALAQELALVNAEIRAGVEREQALRHLSDRTGLDDIRGLVGLLVQTMRFGTSISDALRVYSEEFRDKRMQRAEEQAGKISTKLIFPLVLFLFPGFFVVAVGPAAIRIVQVFSQLTTSK